MINWMSMSFILFLVIVKIIPSFPETWNLCSKTKSGEGESHILRQSPIPKLCSTIIECFLFFYHDRKNVFKSNTVVFIFYLQANLVTSCRNVVVNGNIKSTVASNRDFF